MSVDQGHVEVDRRVDSIVVGVRHRTELGDLRPLMDSIDRLGLLQPVTISPEGLLVCGRRRLEAVKRLGWHTLRVWVRTGLSDDLSQLLAQQDENLTHKPLAPIEAAELYRELKKVVAEDAARRQRATRFGATPHHASDGAVGHNKEPGRGADGDGAGDSPAPHRRGEGDARRQAAQLVSQRDSHQLLERICEMERLAADPAQSAAIQQVVHDELDRIRNGGAVDPGYQRVKAAIRVADHHSPDDTGNTGDTDEVNGSGGVEEFQELAQKAFERAKSDRARRVKENRAKRAAAAANTKRSVRSFALLWVELEGWSRHYDAADVAAQLGDEDWARFLRVLEETTSFADTVTSQRSGSPT